MISNLAKLKLGDEKHREHDGSIAQMFEKASLSMKFCP